MESKFISYDLIRMMYKVEKEIEYNDTSILLCSEEGEQGKSVLVINRDTCKYLEYHNVEFNVTNGSHFLIQDKYYGCDIYNSYLYLKTTDELAVLELNNIEEIAKYKNVSYAKVINHGKVYVLLIGTTYVLFDITKNKEMCKIDCAEYKGRGVEVKLINDNIAMLYDSNLYSTFGIYTTEDGKRLTKGKYIKILRILDDKIIYFDSNKIYAYNFKECKFEFSTDARTYKLIGKNLCIGFNNKLQLINIYNYERVREVHYNMGMLADCMTKGNQYKFFGCGNVGIILDIEDDEIIKIIEGNNLLYAETMKNSYCDLIIFDNKQDDEQDKKPEYMSDKNYYICNRKIFTLKEFLEHLTIKEIEPVYNKDGVIKHYSVKMKNGMKGILSYNFRKLQINGLINNENILDCRFDFIKDRYLA